MNLPKPPVPPLPPPEPPLELIKSIFEMKIKNNTQSSSTDDKLKSFFIESFIPNSQNNLLRRFEIKKINEKTLYPNITANENLYNQSSAESIITENLKRKNLVTNGTANATTNLIRNLWSYSRAPSNFTTNNVSIEKTFKKNDLIFEPIVSNSTFYLINVFLFSICLISICFFLLMLIIVTKRCRKSQKGMSGRSSPSSSASSISFVPCYATSFDSSLHGSKKSDNNNSSLSSFETSLQPSLNYFKREMLFNNDGSPAKYYTIGDNFLDSNFQLKRANYLIGNSISIPKDSWFAPNGNEYDIIPDNSSENSKLSNNKFEGLSTFGVNQKVDKFQISASTIPIVRQQIEDLYNLDQKNLIPSYGQDRMYDISKCTKNLENYHSRFSSETNNNQALNNNDSLFKTEATTLRMFPRTNPFCRNLNYVSNYSSRAVWGNDEFAKKSGDASLCSKL